MDKKKISLINLGVLSTLILVGIILLIILLVNPLTRNNVIKVDVNDEGQKIIEFKNVNFVPGTAEKYTIKLETEVKSKYTITFDFNETEVGNLKEYVYVKVENDEEVLMDKLLKDAFDGETLVLSEVLKPGAPIELEVTYYMPENTGNAAKGEKAVFELIITATNK